MAGVLYPGTALDDYIAQMRGQQQANNQLQDPTLGQPILSQPLASMPAPNSGNKRDSVQLAQRTQVPDLTPQPFQPRGFFDSAKTGTPDMALLRFGAGLLGGRNLADGLSKGASGYADQRQQDQANYDTNESRRIGSLAETARLQQGADDYALRLKQDNDQGPLRKLQIETAKQNLLTGRWEAKDGVIIDKTTGKSVLDPVALDALKQIELAKAAASPWNRVRVGNTPWYSASTKQSYIQQNNPDGSVTFQNANTHEMLDSVPPDAVPMPQAGIGKQAAVNVRDATSLYQAGISAQDTNQNLDRLKDFAVNAGGGPGFFKEAARRLSTTLGVDIPDGVDLDSLTGAQQAMQQMLLQYGRTNFKGQGAVSDMERKLNALAGPNFEKLTPAALNSVIDYMEMQNNRLVEAAHAWDAEPDKSDFNRWYFNWRTKQGQNPNPTPTPTPTTTSRPTGAQTAAPYDPATEAAIQQYKKK